MDSSEKGAVALKRANIGTADCTGISAADLLPAASAAQPPSLAEVEAHVQALRALLGVPGEAADIAAVPVAADELARVAGITAAMGPLERWAREEGTHYRSEPSALAQAEAPAAVALCLTTGRPRVAAAALRVVGELLHHPQSCAEVRRAARRVRVDTAGEEGEGEPTAESHHEALAVVVGRLLLRSPGVEELCAAAIGAAAALAESVAEFSFCEDITADTFLDGPLVSAVLGAVQAHADHTDTIVASLRFLAAVCALPRTDGAAEEVPPTSILFCHLGEVLPTVMAALQAHTGNTQAMQHGLAFVRACAAHPFNGERLLQTGAYRLAMQVVLPPASSSSAAEHSWEVFAVAVEVVCYLIPRLDPFQRRRCGLAVRQLLLTRSDARALRIALAMLLTLLRSSAGPQDAGPPAGGDAYAAYALYAQPPGMAPGSAPCDGSRHADAAAGAWLSTSGPIDTPDDPLDTLRFLHELCLPQVLDNLLSYHQTELAMLGRGPADSSGDEEEEEEEGEKADRASLEGLLALGRACLQMMMAVPPRM